MDKVKCHICKTKIRKCKDGFICIGNHKFNNGLTSVVNEINSLDYTKCPECGTKSIISCKCHLGCQSCDNKHSWTNRYYEDKIILISKKVFIYYQQ